MSIQQLIDNVLLIEQEKRARRERSGKWSPSMLGRCYKAQYYNRANEPQSNPPDARLLRVFKAGTLFHDFVQDFYTDAQTEVKVETEDILGFADLVLPDCVIDIKSQHSQAFWYMEKSGYDINKEKYTNILQVCCYAKFLGKAEGRLVFISKDDLCVAEYGFPVSKWDEEIEKELRTLRAFWADKILPPPKPRAYGIDKKTGEGKECQYCNFYTTCTGKKRGEEK